MSRWASAAWASHQYPEVESYLEEILRCLTSRGVRFVVAGVVAVVLHGVERTTMDIDIALDLTAENIGRFREAMDELGLKPLAELRGELGPPCLTEEYSSGHDVMSLEQTAALLQRQHLTVDEWRGNALEMLA